MKKGAVFCYVLVGVFLITCVGASVVSDSNATHFGQGTFYRVFYNSSGFLQLNSSQAYLTGNFSSRVISVGSIAHWNSFSWVQRGVYGMPLPDRENVENVLGGANMTGNVLLFHFNESAGLLAFNDSSSYGNNGTCTSASTCPTMGASGKFGNAGDFDGANDRVEVSVSTSLNFNKTMTLESWIKWDGESGENGNLQNIITAGNWQRSLRVTEPDHFHGGREILVNFNSGGSSTDLYSAARIQNGIWYHVAATYNGSSLRIYVNGKLSASNNTVSGDIIAADSNTFIGAESDAVSNFDGLLDDVAIYNRSLSADEIYDHYLRGSVRFNVSVRSCDDALCAGESFSSINTTSPSALNVSNNTYFQYLFAFESDNESGSPALYNVSINYTLLNSAPVAIIALPSNNSLFSHLTLLPLNFSVSDAESNIQSCWYSLNYGVNTSILACANTTFSGLEGNITLSLFVNDTLGAFSFNTTSFRIDSLPPSVNIVTPLNASSTSSSIFLNYSLSDSGVGGGACWYYLDASSALSLPGCSTASISGLSDGGHSVNISANDSLGNTNSSIVYFSIDSTAPQSSAISTRTPGSFDASLSTFNITWNDGGVGVNTVLFESNFSGIPRNYTATSLGNGRYSFSGNLPAGTYYWTSYANDTLGNSAKSSVQTFSISQAANPFNFSINGNSFSSINVSYGTTTNVSASGGVGTATLYRNGISVSNPDIQTLGVGNYNYTYTVTGNTNYSSNSSSLSVQVLSQQTAVHLFINGNESHGSITYGSTSNVSAYGYNGSVSLYRNGISVSNPDIQTLGVGNYNYTAVISSTENITGSSVSWFFSVGAKTPSLSLTLNALAANFSASYGNTSSVFASNSNTGDEDVSYTLYRNGILVGSGSSVSETALFGTGEYLYEYNASGGENYTSRSVRYAVLISKSTPPLFLTLNGSFANATYVYGNGGNAAASINVSSESITFYRNNVLLGTGNTLLDSDVLGGGLYNYTAFYAGNENYSSFLKTLFLTVNRTSSSVSLLINGVGSDTSAGVGDDVSISASVVSPSGGIASIYENGVLVSNAYSYTVVRNYTSVGSRTWTIMYPSDQNYSASNKSYIINVLDGSDPHYSSLLVSPSSPTSYVSGWSYQFNATWTDNIGIDNVIFQFNRTNYTYAQGSVQKQGNEYSVLLSDLPAGTFSYRWYANDTSGNVVATSSQIYTIDKSVAALFLTMSPSSSLNYGSNSSVACAATTSQASVLLTRNSASVSNPDTSLLAPGTYNYACTAPATQNFTSASSTGILTVSKSSSLVSLSLNGNIGNLTLSPGGGNVSIEATLLQPFVGQINLTLDDELIAQGTSSLNTSYVFSAPGNYILRISYEGNANYSALVESYSVVVLTSTGQTSGGGSHGGGGGGGGAHTTPIPELNITHGILEGGPANVSFGVLENISVQRGMSKAIAIDVENTGQKYLNNCSLYFYGDSASWFTGDESTGLSPGQKFSYVVAASIPREVGPGIYDGSAHLMCDELEANVPFSLQIYQTDFEIALGNYRRDGSTLFVDYSLQEYAHTPHSVFVEYSMVDLEGITRVRGNEKVSLDAGAHLDRTLQIELPKDSFGEFDFRVRASDPALSLVTNRSLFLPSGRSAVGYVVSDATGKKLSLVFFVALLLFFIGFSARFIYRHYSNHMTPRGNSKRFIKLHVS